MSIRKTMAAVIGLLAMACGGPSGGAVAARSDEANEANGATVDRGTGKTFIFTGDPDQRLYMTMGATVDAFRTMCQSGPDPALLAPFARIRVTLPVGAGTDVQKYQGHGETPVAIFEAPDAWDWTTAFPTFDAMVCEAVLTSAPIATGTVHFSFTTNDNHWSPDAGRTTSWHLSMEGTVYAADGTPMHVVHAGHCSLADPADLSTLTCQTHIQLR